MKTTFDLPQDLVRELKLRAVNEGRKLQEVATEVLRRGLSQPPPKRSPLRKTAKPKYSIQENGLPVFHCSPKAPATRLTTKQLLSLEQEALKNEDLRRVGLPS